uniref:Uncharacterized protein n=1 Tax=Chenopodium quinoa TaxID=63459 RepID=A0A803N7V2_CHEQI
MFKRHRRNEDGVSNIDNYLYNSGGRVVGKKENVRLDDKSLKQAHCYVLLHSDELTPVLNEFLKLKWQENDVGGSQADESIENQWISDEFADWLQSQVHNLDDSMIDGKLRKALAGGLRNRGKRMKSVIINGYKIDIVDRERFRVTQNSGIMVEAEGHEYYGKLKEVLKLHYYGSYKMTYRIKRTREILVATAKSHDPLLAKSPTTTTARESSAIEVVSHPTKKQAIIKSPQTEKNYPAKVSSKVSPNIPPTIPQSIRPDSSSNSLSTSHKPIEQAVRRGIQNLETGAVKTSAIAPKNNQERQNSGKQSEKIPKQSKSLRPKALPDWPADIDFDDKEEDRFLIPSGAEYDSQALKRANKCWRQFKYSLKLIYYKPLEKKLDDICNNVPHGITSSNLVKLVKYWDSDYGKTMSTCDKKARASQNQIHTSGSKSFANQQADYAWNIYVILYLLRILVRAKPGVIRQGNASSDLFNKASEFLRKAKHQGMTIVVVELLEAEQSKVDLK